MAFWTIDRLKYAFERHYWYPTIADTADALTEEWQHVVTGYALSNALNKAFPDHSFASTVGEKLKMQQRDELRAFAAEMSGSSGDFIQCAPRDTPTPRQEFDASFCQNEAKPPERHGQRIIVIPDPQCKPGVPLDHMKWAADYIADEKPDGVLCLGDLWDMPSLSTYEAKAKKSWERRRYDEDIAAGNEGMKLLSSYRDRWQPSWEWYLDGNHDHRITRMLQEEPQWTGQVGLHDRWTEGWEVKPFLEVVELPGTEILASHYFTGPTSPRPIGGTAHNLLRKVGKSCIMGHRQILDSACSYLPDGTQRRAVIAGSYYLHDEHYRQSNGEWRGVLVLNEVIGGTWDQCEVSIGYLRRKYG